MKPTREEEELSTEYNGSTVNCLHSKEHGPFIRKEVYTKFEVISTGKETIVQVCARCKNSHRIENCNFVCIID